MADLYAATKSSEELAKVKTGLLNPDALPYELLGWLFLILVGLIAFSVTLGWLRRRRRQALFQGWTTISDPHRIAEVFQRAAGRQANCTLEIFDHLHTTIYRGQVFDAEPESRISLELSRLPDGDVDFENFPAQVHLNFRPGPKQAMEHYQFSSHTLGINFQREKTWRVARVTVAWPKSIISAQRRDFLRVEPAGDYALEVTLREAPEVLTESPESLPALAEGTVMDISVGGLQFWLPGLLGLGENQFLLVTLNLPVAGLEVDLKATRLHVLLSPLFRDVIAPPAKDEAESKKDTRTIIRGSFIGRYRRSPETGLWSQAKFSEEAFQDLAHWIHAYQRHVLKKEKGLLPFELDRVNIYPAVPPERPPRKGDDDDLPEK